MKKTLLILLTGLIPFLGLSQEENLKEELLNNTVDLYKIIKQEENLYYLAKEQQKLLKESDLIIKELLSEIEQLKEIRLLDEERFRLKDEIIEQQKKRRISIIGYSGFGYDFVKIRPQIGIGIGIELFRLK